MAEAAVDVLIATGLVAVAWSALAARELQAGIVLFIAFGLLLALAWARLGAPDVALAEAAIGAGVTGALLLEALARLRGRGGDGGESPPAEPRPEAESGRRPGPFAGAAAALVAAVAAVALAAAALALPSGRPGLWPEVSERLADSGVDHPVTAVLLNFRAYDTWLEIAVLLVAVAAILVVIRAEEPPAPGAGRPGELLGSFTRAVVPVMLLVALYLLWRGTSGPGGAFQAGAVLAAAGILLHATRIAPRVATFAWRHRTALGAGVAAFAALGAWGLVAGEPPLAYPSGAAGSLIVAIEAGVMLTVAGALAGVLAAVAGAGGEEGGNGEP